MAFKQGVGKQGAGAAFHPALHTHRADLILRKGFRRDVDSYSTFFENDQATPTGLEGYLPTRGICRLVMVGLATDYYVAFSAIDAERLGFRVRVDTAGCRAIDRDGYFGALARMQAAGMQVLGETS